jgi:hypothetical protein
MIGDRSLPAHGNPLFLEGFRTPSGAEFDLAGLGGPMRLLVGRPRQFLRGLGIARSIDTQREGLRQRRSLAGFAGSALVCRDFFSLRFRCSFDLFGTDRHTR